LRSASSRRAPEGRQRAELTSGRRDRITGKPAARWSTIAARRTGYRAGTARNIPWGEGSGRK
jgi:hypothetical protein